MSEMADPTPQQCDAVLLELTLKAIEDRLPGILKGGLVGNTGQHQRSATCPLWRVAMASTQLGEVQVGIEEVKLQYQCA